jgi:dTDP-4-dehydrorhamnose reductase
MRVVVFGKTGQVATELSKDPRVTCLGRDKADFSDPSNVIAAANDAEADVFINAVAYTAVDKAEEEEPLATAVNGASVTALAEVSARRNIPLVHISTDYVFDGSGADPWQATDITNPLGAYGRSKLAGEDGIAASGAVGAVMRTSWVFSAHGANFVKTMLRLGADRDRLTIVADQIGGPTPAADIATACLEMAEQLIEDASKAGVYHFAGAPSVSWADFARAIFEDSGLSVDVADIPSSDYPTPAARPMNSRLDCSAIETVFGIKQPDWRVGLKDVLSAL